MAGLIFPVKIVLVTSGLCGDSVLLYGRRPVHIPLQHVIWYAHFTAAVRADPPYH